ncbi:DUF1573 domain-containing protein [Winogradskyella psychrotolerans]|uniref:DUF1573 domain-containing protein n=1 Tax=Winogradskyella psychrotolerans TaxID=1344585 RepID=UPI001C07EA74|nr:DUF1573 domain-containing protein [Winogradskyella psychrotolerans]MBU2929944.1 DUF1573 domain-containing protein [Winogradskyella psychrotolerans]
MKKVILGLSALCLVAFTSCKDDAASKIKTENIAAAADRDANAGDFAVLTLDKTEHDFGTIANGTPVETIFKYTNTGNSMLVVSDIKSTCGCTVPTNYTKEVQPGETGQFTVKFNGKGNGKTTKSLTMITNTEKGQLPVKITAFIEADPNAATKQAAKPAGTATINPLSTDAAAPRKYSTQPGHEGHNHD